MGREIEVVAPPPRIPADMTTPCGGYTGPSPLLRREFAEALLAERGGRLCAEGKLRAIAQLN